MSPGRIIGAGIVGGVVMFLWGAIAHMGLQLDQLALKSLPGEEMVVPAFKFSIQERGVYVFPGMEEGEMTAEAQKAWEERYKAGPRGMVVYDPTGAEMMGMGQLGSELASNILAALFAAIVLSRVGGSRGAKTMVAGCLGLIGWLSIDVSYWNWYRFSNGFALASGIEQVAGWLLCGGAIALVLGGKKRQGSFA